MGKLLEKSLRPVEGWINLHADLGTSRGFRAAALSFIERHFGRGHTYYFEFSNKVSENHDSHIRTGIAILQAIRSEIAGGWLSSVKTLVTAEIFSDFLEMTAHLLSTGYKDPAAVMIGSVLEEHLRQLARSAGIDVNRETDGVFVPKKAELLNAELAKAEVYSKLDQKAITTWLDLRNKAAHGKYGEYETKQVELMQHGITEFMIRVSP